MVNNCCIKECPTRTDKTIKKTLHRFPLTNKYFCAKWLDAAGIPPDVPKKDFRICSVHFKETDTNLQSKKKILRPGAVPSLNLPNKGINQPTHEVYLDLTSLQEINEVYLKISPQIIVAIRVQGMQQTDKIRHFEASDLARNVKMSAKVQAKSTTDRLTACRARNVSLRESNRIHQESKTRLKNENAYLLEKLRSSRLKKVKKDENCVEVLDSMGTEQRFEEFGKEYLCGFVAFKLKETYPEICATVEEVNLLAGNSRVIQLSQGGLTVPSLQWRNQANTIEREFSLFHCQSPNQIYQGSGVLKGFTLTLSRKYPEIPAKAIERYLTSRFRIRLKAVNKKLKKQTADKRQKRSEYIYKATQLKVSKQLEELQQSQKVAKMNPPAAFWKKTPSL